MQQTHGASSQDVLEQPISGGRSLSALERRAVDHSERIRGWGSDLDPKRRPGVPRDLAPDLGPEHLYPPIAQQEPTTRIHKSTEHARLTPVFGTSCPPSGLSGRMRDYAYRLSEGRLSRWLTLMAADRVHVVEGLIGDLARGHVPNLLKEMGWKSEWRYNRAGFIRKAAITAALAGTAIALWRMRRSR